MQHRRADIGTPPDVLAEFPQAQSARGAASSETNPTRLCDLSQNGLFCDCPQRQRTIALPSGSTNSTPSASTTRAGPSTLYGPFRRALIVTSVMRALYGRSGERRESDGRATGERRESDGRATGERRE